MPIVRASGGKVRRKLAPFDRAPLQKQWRLVFAIACFAAAAVGSTACSRSSGSSPAVTVEHEISPQPARVGPITITLRLTDAAAKRITGASVALEADMSHPGMSPVFGEAKEVEPGSYQGRIDVTMAGDWVILLHITLAGGQKLERQVDVKGVRSN
jgi:hypothetical protein